MILMDGSVTPLDVVRVRLQSQPTTMGSSFRNSSIPLNPSFVNVSPNLGVSACCREVFWVNNNADFCLATPSNLAPNNLAGPSSTTASAAADCAVEETQRRTFTSTVDGLRKIARHEGATTLWRGLSPTLAMAIPGNVIYFTGYDWLRYSQRSPLVTWVPDAYAPLLAGSLARVTAAIAISPIEMLRTRLQATSSSSRAQRPGTRRLYLDTLRDLKQLAQIQGYSALWRGLSLTLWRDVPFSGLYWWGYEAVHNALKDARVRFGRHDSPDVGTLTRDTPRRHELHSVTILDSFIAGAVSGGIASVITTPFDVGKTRQQVSHQAGDTASTTRAPRTGQLVPPEQQTMARFLWHIFREEGLAGLWKGWAARCLKVAPACAIMISTYEIGKKMAQGMNERRDE